RKTDIGAVLQDSVLQILRMHRAATFVDVHAVGLVAHGEYFGAELVKNRRRDVIRRAVRAVDDDLETLQIELARIRALAELDVAPTRVVDAECLAELFR